MKKLLVALLALALVGGAFAQTYSLSTSGSVTIYDQDGNAAFARDGSGYDLLTFKGADKDGKWGYSATINNFDSATFLPATASPLLRDWSAWFAVPQAKIILGKVRNGDFRGVLPNGWKTGYGATDRFFGGAAYGVIAETTGLGALTLGLGLPIGETAATAVDNTFEMMNLGAKYATDTFTAKGLVELNVPASTTILNFALDFTGVKDLDVVVLANVTSASTTTEWFDLGAYYTMGKLTPGLELEVVNGSTMDYNATVNVGYALTDALSAYVRGTYASVASATSYGVDVNATYDFGNGLNAQVDFGYATAVTYDVKLGYSISF